MQTPNHTAAENTPLQAFAPLPLRALGVLEIIDTAIKLLRRYFLVLIAWSAIVMLGSNGVTLLTVGMSTLSGNADPIETASSIIGASFFGMLLAFFLWPLITGAVTCCIAAAVRGQNVTFGQCWNFTKPRYGKILGTYFLSALTAFGIMIAFLIAIGMIIGLGAFTMQAAGDLSGIVIVIGIVLLYVSLAIVGLASLAWMVLAPIVACLENDPHTTPLRRAWDLLKGNWRRAMNLALLFMLIQLVVTIIISTLSFSTAGTMSQGGVEGFLTSWGQATSSILYMLLNTLASIITTPLMLLLVAVLYLDLRTRKEALDLEWTAHVTSEGTATQPNMPRDVPQAASPPFTPQPPTPFNNITAPPLPVDAPPISPETQAAWLGTSPSTLETSPSTNPQTSNTQILPGDNTSSDITSNATTPDATISADVSTHNITATGQNSFDTPINVWTNDASLTESASSATAASLPDASTYDASTSPASASEGSASTTSLSADLTLVEPGLNLNAPAPAPQPSFTQLLPDNDNPGSPASGQRVCSQCGATAQPGQSFCMQCGARLPASGTS